MFKFLKFTTFLTTQSLEVHIFNNSEYYLIFVNHLKDNTYPDTYCEIYKFYVFVIKISRAVKFSGPPSIYMKFL